MEPVTDVAKGMFPLIPVYYPDVQNIMSDFESLSVMSEPVFNDVDGEEESGAGDEMESDDYSWGVTDGFGSVGLC